MISGCNEHVSPKSEETIKIGASLPFTGSESAMGRNLEQAILLAIEDVNAVNGIGGVPLELISRDSNSGSERGLDDLRIMLYDDEVKYVIGPEEYDLASKIVQDIKALNVLNILPGFAVPGIRRSTQTGSWLRLAPDAYTTACAFSAHAVDVGDRSTNTLASNEDYNATLASAFSSQMGRYTGATVPSVRVTSNQSTYADELERVFSYGADKTMLIAYPATAATIINEWSVMGGRGSWFLSPILRTEVFLWNIPYSSLDGAFGMSPTLSLASECQLLQGEGYGEIPCVRSNAEKFIAYYAARWEGTKPYPAAHFYYDAVVLLAMGLQYGLATTGSIPSPKQLQPLIRSLNAPTNAPAFWHDLPVGMSAIAAGQALRYVGTAAEYEFDSYGAAKHRVMDMWEIKQQTFVETGSYYAYCVAPP